MRRFWIVWLAVSVALLAGTSLALSVRARQVMQVSESNGYRTLIVRKFGLFPVCRTTPVPGLDVSREFERDLRRQGLRLPKGILSHLADVERSVDRDSYRYAINGRVAGSLKDAVDEFVPLGKRVTRLSRPDVEQLSGTCIDGKTDLLVQAHEDRGATYLNVYLDIPRGR